MIQRSHFISFVYECKLPDDFEIDNGERKMGDAGYLEWHDKYPNDMLKVHEFYKKYFKK